MPEPVSAMGLPNLGYVPADVLTAMFPYLTYQSNMAQAQALAQLGEQGLLQRAQIAAGSDSERASATIAAAQASAAAQEAAARIGAAGGIEQQRLGGLAQLRALAPTLQMQTSVANQSMLADLATKMGSGQLRDAIAGRLALYGQGAMPGIASALNGMPSPWISAPSVDYSGFTQATQIPGGSGGGSSYGGGSASYSRSSGGGGYSGGGSSYNDLYANALRGIQGATPPGNIFQFAQPAAPVVDPAVAAMRQLQAGDTTGGMDALRRVAGLPPATDPRDALRQQPQTPNAGQVITGSDGRQYVLEGGFANGTPGAGKGVLVGEEGPEVLRVNKQGMEVIPLMGAAAGGANLNPLMSEYLDIKKQFPSGPPPDSPEYARIREIRAAPDWRQTVLDYGANARPTLSLAQQFAQAAYGPASWGNLDQIQGSRIRGTQPNRPVRQQFGFSGLTSAADRLRGLAGFAGGTPGYASGGGYASFTPDPNRPRPTYDPTMGGTLGPPNIAPNPLGFGGIQPGDPRYNAGGGYGTGGMPAPTQLPRDALRQQPQTPNAGQVITGSDGRQYVFEGVLEGGYAKGTPGAGKGVLVGEEGPEVLRVNKQGVEVIPLMGAAADGGIWGTNSWQEVPTGKGGQNFNVDQPYGDDVRLGVPGGTPSYSGGGYAGFTPSPSGGYASFTPDSNRPKPTWNPNNLPTPSQPYGDDVRLGTTNPYGRTPMNPAAAGDIDWRSIPNGSSGVGERWTSASNPWARVGESPNIFGGGMDRLRGGMDRLREMFSGRSGGSTEPIFRTQPMGSPTGAPTSASGAGILSDVNNIPALQMLRSGNILAPFGLGAQYYSEPGLGVTNTPAPYLSSGTFSQMGIPEQEDALQMWEFLGIPRMQALNQIAQATPGYRTAQPRGFTF